VTATAVGALVIILLGWLARRVGVLRPKDGPILVQVVIYLALPALVLHVMVTADLDASLALVPIVGYVVHGVLLVTMLAVARFAGYDRPTTGALLVATAVGNTGFFGIPLIAASGANLSVPTAVMFDAFCTGILTWTSTVWIAGRFGDRSAESAPTTAMWRNLLLPPTWALAVGLTLNLGGVHDLPEVIERPLEILGGAVLPLVLIYAGLVIEWDGVRRAWREVGLVTVGRFVIAPAVGLAVALALGLDGDVLRTVVLMTAMPTAMMSLVIGGWFKLRTDVIAGAVVVTTLLATVVLPTLRALL
jgi:malate permease and related proteins